MIKNRVEPVYSNHISPKLLYVSLYKLKYMTIIILGHIQVVIIERWYYYRVVSLDKFHCIVNWFRWICSQESPCGDVLPRQGGTPEYCLLLEASNLFVEQYVFSLDKFHCIIMYAHSISLYIL